jgi:hypothetical protein
MTSLFINKLYLKIMNIEDKTTVKARTIKCDRYEYSKFYPGNYKWQKSAPL